MSFTLMRWAVGQPLEDPAAKLLLIILANYANERGKAWPNQGRLAADCGMSERNVRYKLELLEKLGLITIHQTAHRSGRKSFYYLTDAELPNRQNSNRQNLPVQPAGFATDPINEPVTSLSLSGAEDPGKPPSPGPKRPSPLPDSWEPSPADRDWASEALPTVDVNDETNRFREWHQSRGELRLDWSKCWRLWLRRSADYAKRRPAAIAGGQRPRNSDGVRERMAAFLDRYPEPIQETPRRRDEG